MEGFFQSLGDYLQTGSAIAYIVVLAGGILTSFTPCIYPIIPVTLGYIGANAAGSKTKGLLLSIFYVAGMAFTYSALGAAAALTGRLFGVGLTNPVVYFLVGNFWILLALSMLGVFSLPNIKLFSGPNKSPDSHGMLSAFIVGLLAGLVVSPCTAPVLAVILAHVAAKKDLVYGCSLLFTYAFGMGAVLIALGAFTGLLVSMPKAGPWLEKIKKGFGWILLFGGEYFLIMAGRLSI